MTAFSIGGMIWTGRQATQGILHIDQGKVLKVAKTQALADHTDFGEKLILPGAIDVHVHFREPGATHKEDIASGSRAAAFGGVTGYVDMPNTLPPTTTARTVDEKLELMAASSFIDYAVWAGATWYTGDLDAVLENAIGMKVYLGATTGDLNLDDRSALVEVLTKCGQHGKPVIFHCESQRVLDRQRRAEAKMIDHDQARPPVAEVEAIYEVMKALPGIKTPPRVHVAHIASREALQAARSAKFSVGVCPHHLMLHSGADPGNAFGKVNPPIRAEEQRAALMAAFAGGEIPILESDHAPHTKLEKQDPFQVAPAGLPGVETMVPLMMARVAREELELGTLVQATTKGPAEMLGVDRGHLGKGAWADIAVYDLQATEAINASKLHSKAGWSLFDGMDAIFPTDVYVRGEAVVKDRKLADKKPKGRPLADPS